MKASIAPWIGFVGVFCILGQALAQEAAPAQPRVAPRGDIIVTEQAGERLAASGLYLRTDGSLVARVSSIDAGTLELKPVAGATVTFLKERQVVARAVTDSAGMFMIQGLKPNTAYSVFVNSADWIAVFGTAVRALEGPGAAPAVASKGDKFVNELRLVAHLAAAEGQPQELLGGQGGGNIQAVPRGDFLMALEGGEPAPDGPNGEPLGQPVPMGQPIGGGFVGGGGGGGGGFGGGGGGGGGMLGAAAGFAGLALGITAVAEEKQPVVPESPAVP